MLNSTAQLAKSSLIDDLCGDEVDKSDIEQGSTRVLFSKKSSET